jgi:uncharacterized protein (DUF849 family)
MTHVRPDRRTPPDGSRAGSSSIVHGHARPAGGDPSRDQQLLAAANAVRGVLPDGEPVAGAAVLAAHDGAKTASAGS